MLISGHNSATKLRSSDDHGSWPNSSDLTVIEVAERKARGGNGVASGVAEWVRHWTWHREVAGPSPGVSSNILPPTSASGL